MAADDPDLAIQTHISENASEIKLTLELFPECSTYAGVYHHFGLLRPKTILAHGCHLGDDELELIRRTGAGISHCPTSNFNLRSGMAHVGDMLDKGIKVGLGTDMSGGYSPSILTAIQHASICSKILALQSARQSTTRFSSKQHSLATLLHLATLGGADVCGLSKVTGNFSLDKDFDALLVDVRHLAAEGHPGNSPEDQLEKFFFCGDDRNISAVWVRNTVVGGCQC